MKVERQKEGSFLFVGHCSSHAFDACDRYQCMNIEQQRREEAIKYGQLYIILFSVEELVACVSMHVFCVDLNVNFSLTRVVRTDRFSHLR